MSEADRGGRAGAVHAGRFRARPTTKPYLEDYPALATEPVYVLQSGVDQADIDRLNPVMGKALLTVCGIEQAAGQS